MDETFFVKIDDSEKLRISVLSSSKNSLESLKIHLKLQDIHKKKLDAKAILIDQFSEFSSTLQELNNVLPHQEILEDVKKHHKSKKKSSPKKSSAKKSKSSTKSLSELDKLNDALEGIEKKLNTLQ